MAIALAVHGGAWNIPDHLWEAHQIGCRKAWRAGMDVLEQGGDAVAAICAALVILEDDPTFDAGFGSFLNEEGRVELDAGLMEGNHLKAGAVLGVSRVKNPILLARHVLDTSNHCLFTAEGAHRMAERAGLEMVDPEVHVHPREREVHQRVQAGDSSILDSAWRDQPGDTVGAIALDVRGNMAAGNSTGGIINKAVGRVGDAPLMGSGFYADNELGAVVCTGWGEPIMRSAMAMQGLLQLPELGPESAARFAIDHLARRVDGYGGVLYMTPDGRCGAAHNTQRMARYY